MMKKDKYMDKDENTKMAPCDLPEGLQDSLLGMNLSILYCNVDNDNNTYIQICGGNNGKADWKQYLKNIYSCLAILQNTYDTEYVRIASMDCDDIDDIFYVTFIIQILDY